MEKDITQNFKEYSSIDGVTQKNIKKLEKYGHLNKNIEWIALEKIHGANLSFLTDGVTISTAKRSGIIDDKENFFNSTKITEKYQKDVLEIFHRIKASNNIPNIVTVQLYGEVFGGSYIGFESSSKPVQKGVYYKPEIDFLIFDIRINTSDIVPNFRENGKEVYWSWYLAQDEINKIVEGLNIKTIPIEKKGPFSEIVTMNPVFVTKIPSLYGLPVIENNMAEGYVFKTNENHVCHHTRPIIKTKNTKIFGEIDMCAEKMCTNLSDNLISNLIRYCTQNRFNNTISKIGRDSHIEKITGIYIADVVKDFEKDFNDTIDELNQEKTTDENRKAYIKKLKGFVHSYLMREGCIEMWLGELN